MLNEENVLNNQINQNDNDISTEIKLEIDVDVDGNGNSVGNGIGVDAITASEALICNDYGTAGGNPNVSDTRYETELETQCSVCLDDIDQRVVLICKHQFCNECMKKLNNYKYFTCPICRGPSIPLKSEEVENGMIIDEEEYVRRMKTFYSRYDNYLINKKIISRAAANRRRAREEREMNQRANVNVCCFLSGIGFIVCCILGNATFS